MEVSGQLHASDISHPPRERAPGTHWIGGCLSPRAGLDAVVKRKIPSPCRDSNPRSSSPQPSSIQLSYLGSSSLLSEAFKMAWRPSSTKDDTEFWGWSLHPSEMGSRKRVWNPRSSKDRFCKNFNNFMRPRAWFTNCDRVLASEKLAVNKKKQVSESVH
jgi:hypothetical protein